MEMRRKTSDVSAKKLVMASGMAVVVLVSACAMGVSLHAEESVVAESTPATTNVDDRCRPPCARHTRALYTDNDKLMKVSRPCAIHSIQVSVSSPIVLVDLLSGSTHDVREPNPDERWPANDS